MLPVLPSLADPKRKAVSRLTAIVCRVGRRQGLRTGAAGVGCWVGCMVCFLCASDGPKTCLILDPVDLTGAILQPRNILEGRGQCNDRVSPSHPAGGAQARPSGHGAGGGRLDRVYTMGMQSSSARLRCVEYYGTRVIPLVRARLGA
jgi:hypothetical protein